VDDTGVCWEGYCTDLVHRDHRASEVGSQYAHGKVEVVKSQKTSWRAMLLIVMMIGRRRP